MARQLRGGDFPDGEQGFNTGPEELAFAVAPNVIQEEIPERNGVKAFKNGTLCDARHDFPVLLVVTGPREVDGPEREAEAFGLGFHECAADGMHRDPVGCLIEGGEERGDLNIGLLPEEMQRPGTVLPTTPGQQYFFQIFPTFSWCQCSQECERIWSMRRLLPLLAMCCVSLAAQVPSLQVHPLQALIEAARTNSPRLKDLLAAGLPGLAGRDGAAVWGQDFLFAVQAETPATVSIDHQPALTMTNVPGTKYWFRLMTLRLGATHNYNYFAAGKSLGTYDVAGYNPDSYPLPGVAHGKLSEMKTLTSKVYPGMSANYWVYVNSGADMTNGAPLMVWQDGETIVGNLDLLRLRLQIVSDNLVAKKLIPPMVHVLIQPGTGGEATGTRMRSILYDTVSDRYGKYLAEEILPEVEKTYKVRHDAYSRAVAGASSGAICAFNVAWYYPNDYSRVLSHIGSYVPLQWKPEQGLDGGYIVSQKVRRDVRKNLRVWLSDGTDDQEASVGSWPLNNIMLANSLKLKGYDFHFRFGEGMHAIAQGAMDLPESLAWLWRDYDPAKTAQEYVQEETEKAKPPFRVKVANREAW